MEAKNKIALTAIVLFLIILACAFYIKSTVDNIDYVVMKEDNETEINVSLTEEEVDVSQIDDVYIEEEQVEELESYSEELEEVAQNDSRE